MHWVTLLWASPKEEQQNVLLEILRKSQHGSTHHKGGSLGLRHPTFPLDSLLCECGLCRTSRYTKRIVFWVNFLRVTLNTTKRVNTDVLTQGGFPYCLNGFHISLRLWIISEVTPWWFPYFLAIMDYHWGNAWMVSIFPCDLWIIIEIAWMVSIFPCDLWSIIEVTINGFHISLWLMDYHYRSHLNGFHISLRLWIIIWVTLGIRRTYSKGQSLFLSGIGPCEYRVRYSVLMTNSSWREPV